MHAESLESGIRAVVPDDDPSASSPKPRHPHLRRFTWHWFTTTMATGSLAVVLFSTPYKFHGLVTAGKVIFIIDLILFVAFTAIITTRFIFSRRDFWSSLYDSNEAFFFGSFWVSVATILQNIALYGVPSCGPWLVKALEVLFWMYFACIFIVAVLQYDALFMKRKFHIANLMPAWLLPMYPILLTGPLASVIMQFQTPQRASPIWICGICSQGLGWMITIFIYAMWSMRLLCEEVPEPSNRPGMYIAVGPTAYTVQAIVSLSTSASKGLPDPFLGQSPKAAAATINTIGIMVGTFMWLLSFWLFALSTVAVLQGARKMKFNLTWWSFIFPNAGLTLATIQLGKAFDSPAINYLACVFVAILFLGWLAIGFCHIKAVLKGTTTT